MAVILSNNATSLLAGNITVSSTTISVTASDAGKFPSPSSDQWFPITIVDASGNMEIMKATKRVGAVITVERAQEGTTAKAFTSGARVDSRLTAAAIFDLVTSETIAKNIQKVTESESVIDTDILAGTDKNGDFLKKWSFAKIKTWIQGWIEAKDVGLDKVPNKTEAEMVASGAIKDELAKRPTVNSTTGRLPVNMIPHLIGADGDGYIRLTNAIDGREGFNTELRLYTNGGGQLIHNGQGILAFGTDGFASVYKNPTSNNHVANKAYVDSRPAWPGVYTGTARDNTNFPVGTYVAGISGDTNRASTVTVRLETSRNFTYRFDGSGAILAGSWRSRGVSGQTGAGLFSIAQRVS